MSVSRYQDISNWIFGACILFSVSIVGFGVWLLFGQDTNSEAMTLDQSPPEDNAGYYFPASEAPNSHTGAISLATVVPWQELNPASSVNVDAIHALERFGQATLGAPKARVTIVEYGSYGCTACRKVHQMGLVQAILDEHVDDVRYVFVAWPVIHSNDKLATEAVLCALDQGSEFFWAYHNALLDLTNFQFNRYSNYARYTTLAEHIDGLDIARFDTCIIDGHHREFVFSLIDAGKALDLRGTPTFFVNGEMVSVYDLDATVDDILADTILPQD